MKTLYADMHCDSLTACLSAGGDLFCFDGHVSLEKLLKSGCGTQCFAVFTEGEKAAENAQSAFEYLKKVLADYPQYIAQAMCADDIINANAAGKIAAVLTVENLGFLGTDVNGGIARLKNEGVKMASLVWNNANALAFPNLIFKGDMPDFAAREKRGLTDLGKQAVEQLNRNNIIIDVSHLSDGGVEDILRLSKKPIVASHSNCAKVYNVSRNLTDAQLKAIADGGGCIGVNFCADFVGENCPDVCEGAVLHLTHIIDVAGEDAAALGSDFDGIPTPRGITSALDMPKLFDRLSMVLPPRVIEKLAYKNFLRVFKEVCG